MFFEATMNGVSSLVVVTAAFDNEDVPSSQRQPITENEPCLVNLK